MTICMMLTKRSIECSSLNRRDQLVDFHWQDQILFKIKILIFWQDQILRGLRDEHFAQLAQAYASESAIDFIRSLLWSAVTSRRSFALSI